MLSRQTCAYPPARTPSLKDGVAQKAWFCGTTAEVIDRIKSIAAKHPGLRTSWFTGPKGSHPRNS